MDAADPRGRKVLLLDKRLQGLQRSEGELARWIASTWKYVNDSNVRHAATQNTDSLIAQILPPMTMMTSKGLLASTLH